MLNATTFPKARSLGKREISLFLCGSGGSGGLQVPRSAVRTLVLPYFPCQIMELSGLVSMGIYRFQVCSVHVQTVIH